MTSFENYLEKVCFKIYPSVLDDEMPDFLNDWLSHLDGEDYMRYGQLYGEECFFEGKKALAEAIIEWP